ncbi:MAG: phosphatidylserine decarboxylase [Treponema sp.]|jgi:phosphatidylserine decarboxylase|nr:phosphatidylserine decarboxylase [Treponema sp.]
MDIFSSFISEYAQFYPLAALVSLLLAGLNIPFSEDLVIITGALLNQEAVQAQVEGARGMLAPSLLAIYSGVIISDFTSYYLGTLIRKGVFRVKYADTLFSQKNLDRVSRHLDKHGPLTFIVCRFIPFGARNTLFMTSGFLGLPLRRFALYDIPAAMISTNTLFFLVYRFGDGVQNPIRVAGIILFVLLILAVLFLVIRFLKRNPLTPWGLPQAAIFPIFPIAGMTALFIYCRHFFWIVPAEAALFLVFFWMLSFFRNPPRKIKEDESILYSPADGRVTEISEVVDDELGPLLRIGIFLSIFNVHLNRSPCSAAVERISYKKGIFKDARDPDSSRVNESNTLLLRRLAEPKDHLLVRQISGAIARHIVCKINEKDELKQGALFGMIKFGSRTELCLPAKNDGKYEVTVKVGDNVHAGITPLVRYL